MKTQHRIASALVLAALAGAATIGWRTALRHEVPKEAATQQEPLRREALKEEEQTMFGKKPVDSGVPPVVANDPRAKQIARLWYGESLYVQVAPDAFQDDAAWGLVLVDLAGHIANAVSERTGQPREAVLARIRAGFDMEWSAPTDSPRPVR